ncbi:Flp family type IVb pilin [Vibrio tapetis]|uniref:Flp/Fap pilin component family protein n=1 Tax=Vibrio tapetis subsp. tapetis TaxID=1671868 RepID=A0A2N8ZJ01_9VIBR|nr:Flp family type IVb pilin [Vibrio tapetis]SON51894.1 Flp/Fap pilin component family protein [Vibrio tapetis subsp. tapetis]
MKNLINQFIKNEDGVTAIEYAVIGVAMAAVLGVAIGADNDAGLRGAINRAFVKISNQIDIK